MIRRLTEASHVKAAARIANQFKMDPIEVLNGTFFEYAVRIAAWHIAVEEERKAQEKANAKKK